MFFMYQSLSFAFLAMGRNFPRAYRRSFMQWWKQFKITKNFFSYPFLPLWIQLSWWNSSLSFKVGSFTSNLSLNFGSILHKSFFTNIRSHRYRLLHLHATIGIQDNGEFNMMDLLSFNGNFISGISLIGLSKWCFLNTMRCQKIRK